MRRALPTGTVTFLFTDVEGSTRLLHELGADAYAEALAEHRRVIREACVREGGVEVDTQGDAFFFAFPTAPGAASAAAVMSKALASGPIQVRVGLHTGTPLLTEEGYVGEDVHRAARIAAAGHGGQVLVSSSTASLVEFELHDLGEHRFKDLSAPEHVFQIGEDDFPPLKTLYQTNLPIPQTPFLGREKELGEVLALLGRDDIRLLTLTGPGGTGKTRLAAQAAGAVAERYRDGVWWVPLAPLREPELVLESAGQALGASNGLASHIAEKRTLLLFDNFEQVIEAAQGLSGLLGACPHLELLVTSREPLHLAGEQEYLVPPFAPEEGVDFFAARARATEPDFDVDEAVAEICQRLDGLPLALELAAARVKSLSTGQILSRLEQRLPLLTGGTRDAPERQRTLRSTIEWSYDLLSPDEQRLLARLSVFAGGCTLEAAEEVCAADLDTLQSLVEKSLLRFLNERYWMLETIREYASERLDGAEERELMARHTKVIAAWAERARDGLKSSDEARWLRAFGEEQSNVRSVLSYLESGGHGESLLDLVWAFGNYWEIRGEWREGRRWADVAIAQSTAQRSLPRAHVLGFAGMFAGHAGDWIVAQAYDEEALSITRELGRLADSLWLLPHLSHVAVELGNNAQAYRWLEEASAIAREVGDLWTLASCDGHMADLALRHRDDGKALELAESALEYYRERMWSAGIAWCLHLRAVAQFRIERRSDARLSAEEGLSLAHSIGDAETRVWLLILFAALESRAGRSEGGAALLGAVHALSDHVELSLTGVEAELRAETEVELRGALVGDSRYDVAYSKGAAMTDDDAVRFALAASFADS